MKKMRKPSFSSSSKWASKEAPGPDGKEVETKPVETVYAKPIVDDAVGVDLGAPEPVRRCAIAVPSHETDRGRCDVAWGFREAHDLLIGMTPLKRRDYAAQRAATGSPLLAPFYWCAIACTIPCLVSGRRVHALLGQGEPLDDESDAEHEARVQWVYCMDGPYAFAGCLALLDAADALSPASFGGGSGDKLAWAYLLDCGITFGYVGGNVAFLESLRRRDLRATRTGIVANASFGLALSVLLAICLARSSPATWSWNQMTKYAIRFGTVFFFVLAATTYRTLWAGRGDAAPPPTKGDRCRTALSLFILSTSPVLVWVLFAVVLVLGDVKIVWDALA